MEGVSRSRAVTAVPLLGHEPCSSWPGDRLHSLSSDLPCHCELPWWSLGCICLFLLMLALLFSWKRYKTGKFRQHLFFPLIPNKNALFSFPLSGLSLISVTSFKMTSTHRTCRIILLFIEQYVNECALSCNYFPRFSWSRMIPVALKLEWDSE